MKRKRLSEAMETLEFIQKPIELVQSSQPYLSSLWETETQILKLYAPIASLFSSMFDILSDFFVQEAILNMVVCELAFNRLTFLADYGPSVRTAVQPEQEYVPQDTAIPSSPVLNVLLVRKLVADLARRMAAQVPKPVAVGRAGAGETKTEAGTAEEPAGGHAKPSGAEEERRIGTERIEEPTEKHAVPEPFYMPFQAVAEVRGKLESGLVPGIRGLASALRAYSSYAVSLSPLPFFMGLGSSEIRGPSLVVPVEEEMPRAESARSPSTVKPQTFERREVEGDKPSLSESIPRRSPVPEISNLLRRAMELPTIISQRQAEVMRTAQFVQALSPPSQLSLLIEEVSPSLASWVYGEAEALRSTGLSLSAVPVAASTAQKIITEALVEPISGFEGQETFEREVPFRLPSVFASLVAAHARYYSPFHGEQTVNKTYVLPSRAEIPYQGQVSKEGALLGETGVSRLPSVIALAAAESLIAQKLRHEMTAFAKDVQAARSTYAESPATISAAGPVRTTKLGELAAVTNFPVPIEPYAPSISPTSPQHMRPRFVDRAIQNTINLTVSAESQEEDLRELERKISKILSEQLSRYYGSTRI